jgi:hypothetical protein
MNEENKIETDTGTDIGEFDSSELTPEEQESVTRAVSARESGFNRLLAGAASGTEPDLETDSAGLESIPEFDMSAITKDEEQRMKFSALQLFMQPDSPDCASVAARMRIPANHVQEWARAGHWQRKRDTMLVEYAKSSDASLGYTQARARVEVARRHLDLAERFEQAISADLMQLQTIPAGDERRLKGLRRSAETFGLVANIAARASALGKSVDLDDFSGNSKGKRNLVQIGISKAVVVAR